MKLMSFFHGTLILVWLGTVLILSLGVATLGNEEAMLSRERGVGLRERRVLIERQDQLRLQLQAEARRDRLEVAVRELGLSLEAPTTPNSTPTNLPFELASYRTENTYQ